MEDSNMGGRLIAELTRESYPGLRKYVGQCVECPDQRKETHDYEGGALAYFRGWFMEHVAETGHRIQIEEVGGA